MKKYLALLFCSFQLSNSMESPANNEEDPISVIFAEKKRKSPIKFTNSQIEELIKQRNTATTFEEKTIATFQLQIACSHAEEDALYKRLEELSKERRKIKRALAKLKEGTRSHSAPADFVGKKN